MDGAAAWVVGRQHCEQLRQRLADLDAALRRGDAGARGHDRRVVAISEVGLELGAQPGEQLDLGQLLGGEQARHTEGREQLAALVLLEPATAVRGHPQDLADPDEQLVGSQGVEHRADETGLSAPAPLSDALEIANPVLGSGAWAR